MQDQYRIVVRFNFYGVGDAAPVGGNYNGFAPGHLQAFCPKDGFRSLDFQWIHRIERIDSPALDLEFRHIAPRTLES